MILKFFEDLGCLPNDGNKIMAFAFALLRLCNFEKTKNSCYINYYSAHEMLYY